MQGVYCFLLLFVTGSQAAAIDDQASLRTSDEKAALKPEEALKIMLYTLDPIGGGNLVTSLHKLSTDQEEARDAGALINKIYLIIQDFEDRYPSIVDKIYQALDDLFVYGPVEVTTEGQAEARQEAAELTTPPNFFVYPLETIIDEAMAAFHKVGGLPGVAQFLVQFSDSAEAAPVRHIINSVFQFIIGMTAQ